MRTPAHMYMYRKTLILSKNTICKILLSPETWLKRKESVVASVLDSNIILSEFERQSRYYVHFQTSTLGKGMKPLIHPSTMGYIVTLLFFQKDGLCYKYPSNVNMPLNKSTKPWLKNQCSLICFILTGSMVGFCEFTYLSIHFNGLSTRQGLFFSRDEGIVSILHSHWQLFPRGPIEKE